MSIKDYTVIVAIPCWTLGGVNVFAADLVRGLQANGILAWILLTEQNTRLVSWTDIAIPLPTDIPVEQLPVRRHESWGAHWGAMIRYLEGQGRCIYLPNYDWRHACVSPKLSNQIAVVGVIHADDPLYYDQVKRLGPYWNALVAVDNEIAGKAILPESDSAIRPKVIPYGVHIPDLFPDKSFHVGAPLRIVYAGRLVQHPKRILDLPRIAEALLELNVPLELTIVGDGVNRQQFVSSATRLMEKGIIKLLGFLPHNKIGGILQNNDVFVLTSETEGLPLSLLEAMAHGCVPVVTDIPGGIAELIQDGVNGFRVPIGCVRLFAERLSLLQQDVTRRLKMSLNAYRTVSEGGYRTQDMIQQYIELFQKVLHEAERGDYRRPPGLLLPPPREVEGVAVFPVDYTYEIAGVGLFPSRKRDYKDYLKRLKR